jgi:hypothetical protein
MDEYKDDYKDALIIVENTHNLFNVLSPLSTVTTTPMIIQQAHNTMTKDIDVIMTAKPKVLFQTNNYMKFIWSETKRTSNPIN